MEVNFPDKISIKMMTIYKQLPKTNCGECGLPTCLAFALKVSKAQADLSGCPFMSAADVTAQEKDPDKKRCSTYEEVSEAHEREAAATDFRETAELIGAANLEGSQAGEMVLRVLNREYVLRKTGLYDDKGCSPTPWMKIIVCDYIRRRGRKELTGKWMALGHFPHTASHIKAFQASAEKKIAERFRDNPEELKRRSAELGGFETEGVMKADYLFRFDLLPHVPLLLAFWKPDEEFEAEAKLFFDSNAADHIDIEYLGHLVEIFTAEITGE
jgi:hypothetical protein